MWLQSEQHLRACSYRLWSITREKARLSRGDKEVIVIGAGREMEERQHILARTQNRGLFVDKVLRIG